MSDTPRTDAVAAGLEHLGTGGRALYQRRLWSLAYTLERELASARAERVALLEALKFIADHDLRGADLTVAGHIAHALIGKARAVIAKLKGGLGQGMDRASRPAPTAPHL